MTFFNLASFILCFTLTDTDSVLEIYSIWSFLVYQGGIFYNTHLALFCPLFCACTFYMASLPEKDARKTTGTLDWRYQAMDRITRCRVCSARKGHERVESFGVHVSDLQSSVMRGRWWCPPLCCQYFAKDCACILKRCGHVTRNSLLDCSHPGWHCSWKKLTTVLCWHSEGGATIAFCGGLNLGFTVRCYEECGIATTRCLFVMLRYRGHIGWNYLKIISPLVSLRRSLIQTPTLWI